MTSRRRPLTGPADARRTLNETRRIVANFSVGPANLPPVPVSMLAPLTVGLDEGAVTVEVSGAFRDPDGDALTYEATSSAPAVATAGVAGSDVTVTPLSEGTALVTVTVTATDTAGSNTAATQSFAVTVGPIASEGEESLFVPVLLTSAGRNNAYFTSELTLTNRGSEEAILHYTYTAHAGGGSGTATDTVALGQQRIQRDAIGYLTGLGIPIPGSGNRIGTLRVEVSGSSQVSVTTRTTTGVPDGRAGLAYPGIAEDEGFQEAVYLCGLRENRQDRSNLAVQNMGASTGGPITLRTTVFSAEADDTAPRVLGDLELKPGEFHQYNQVLKAIGSSAQGYVKVERVGGTAPFYAYGVVNDNFNSDGSFVFPVTGSSLVGTRGQTLPVVIETGNFQSELTLTNFSFSEKTVDFSFVADAVENNDDTASFSLTLKAGEQRVLPRYRGGAAAVGGGGARPGRPSLRRSPLCHPSRGGHERDRDRGADGGSGPERGAVQPLLQRGALWLGFDRKRLDLRAAAERGEPQQPGPGQYGRNRRQLQHLRDHHPRR